MNNENNIMIAMESGMEIRMFIIPCSRENHLIKVVFVKINIIYLSTY